MRGIISTLCLLIVLVSVSMATSLKDQAQQAFIDGSYEKSLTLYDSLLQKGSKAERETALSMKAIIYEECLGEIDSAVVMYSLLLQQSANARRVKRWKRNLDKLTGLGEYAEVYGAYRKLLMSNRSTKEKAQELSVLLYNNPDFEYIEEMGRLLITQYNELGNYIKASQTMDWLKDRGVVFNKDVYAATKRNANREKIVLFTVAFLIITVVMAMLFVFRFKEWGWVSPFIKLSIFWLALATLFEIVYLIGFKNMDNNPFTWYDPFLIMLLNLVPIAWLTICNRLCKSTALLSLMGFVPAAMLSVLLIHAFLYFQKQPMVIMDTFQSQLSEFFFDAEEQNRENNNGKN